VHKQLKKKRVKGKKELKKHGRSKQLANRRRSASPKHKPGGGSRKSGAEGKPKDFKRHKKGSKED